MKDGEGYKIIQAENYKKNGEPNTKSNTENLDVLDSILEEEV